MEEWTTVKVRRKDPGGQGVAQEELQESGGVDAALAGATHRYTSRIRAEFVHNGRNGAFKASAEAKQLAGHLFRIDPKTTFKTESDSNIVFRNMSEFPKGNKFIEFFSTTSYTRNDGSGKVHLNFQIESENRITAFKRDVTFMKLLRDRKIWMTEHKYETHELQAIGYIINKSPVLTHRPQLENDISSVFSDYVEHACDEDKNV